MTPFARIGGADRVRLLSDTFYEAITTDDRFAELRAMHDDLVGVRSAFAAWLSAWLGGPSLPPDPRGCIMSRHRAMRFGPELAQQWLAAMEIALDESFAGAHADADLRSAMHTAFARMAGAMVSVEA